MACDSCLGKGFGHTYGPGCVHVTDRGPPSKPERPTRTVEFRSETSLASFILQLPGNLAYKVVEQEGHPGWYTLTFV